MNTRAQTWSGRLAAGIIVAVLASVAWPARPAAAQEICPLTSDSQVSEALGSAMKLLPFGGAVTVSGPLTSCLYVGNAGLVTVTRLAGSVQPGGGSMTLAEIELLKAGSEEVDYAAVDGVGDAAVWATARDPGVAAERLQFLIVKRGADLFSFGLDHPDASISRAMVTALARVVLASVDS